MTQKLSDPIAPTASYVGMLTESRIWKHYDPRPGDIVVSTPPKSGTTWMQGIMALLISGDPAVNANPSVNAPWFDNRFNDMDECLARLEAQTSRRHVKTHTPLDGIPLWDELRYVLVYRHPIDVHFSARKHVANYRSDAADEIGVNFDNFPENPRDSFRIFVENDEFEEHGCLKYVVNHYLRCMDNEDKENVLRVHYADMTRDLASQVDRVAQHIGVNHPSEITQSLVQAATFGNMKANAERFAIGAGEELWRNDAGFFDSATSNKWDGILTDEDLELYDRAISKMLEPEQRRWLEWGDG